MELAHPTSLEAPAPLPANGPLAPVHRCNPWQARQFAELLLHNGVACRIDSYPPGAQLTGPEIATKFGQFGTQAEVAVYVAPAEAERAGRLREDFLASEMPYPEDGQNLEVDSGCPACGHALEPGAESCPSCGLEFPPEEFICFWCYASVGPEDARCEHCGNDLTGGAA